MQEVDPDGVVHVLEKESELATHQTGRNSGVVHAGLYYTPGLAEGAALSTRGRHAARVLRRSTTSPYDEMRQGPGRTRRRPSSDRLAAIEERAAANGVPGVRRLDAAALREIEPHVTGVARTALPRDGDRRLPRRDPRPPRQVEARGGEVTAGAEVTGVVPDGAGVRLRGTGPGSVPLEVRADQVVLCGGLHSDHLAQLAGDEAGPADRAVPRRVLPAPPREAVRWSTGWSTRCPTRATRSSAYTSPRASTAR